MMNRIAGLIGVADQETERNERLSKALNCHEDVTIVNPFPGVSLAWSCDEGLTAIVLNDECFVFLYGSVYQSSGGQERSLSVNDIEGAAQFLLDRYESRETLLGSMAGSFIMVSGDSGGGLTVSGDSSGNRAPYYAIRDEELALSNHPLVCARIHGNALLNRELEDFLLIYGFYPDGATCYQNVRMLQQEMLLRHKGKSWIRCDMGKPPHGETDQRKFTSENDVSEQLYEVLLSCLQDQLTSARDVGVLLGGFDSALVAALLQRLGKRVHTYSFRYADTQYNQPHTDTLASYLGTEHHWVDITPEVIAEGLENYAEGYVQPTNWLNYVVQSVYICEQIRRDGISDVYTGDGCDTLFLGYPGTYKRTQIFAGLPKLPEFLVSRLLSIAECEWMDRTIGHPYRVAMGMFRAMARQMPSRAFLTFRVMDEVTLMALRKNSTPVNKDEIESIVQSHADPYVDVSVRRLGYVAKSLISPNRAKMVACTDITGVRVHSPYLHPALKKFAAAIPEDFLRKQTQQKVSDPGKICLARMAELQGLLPSEVIYQPKMAAIDSPIDAWFSDELRLTLIEVLGGLPFSVDQRHLEAMINITPAERLYKKHVGSTQVISDAISLLATYSAMCAAVRHQGGGL